jgi:hypothetical protein
MVRRLCGFPPFFNDGTNMAELFDQIMSADFDFPDPYFTEVSADGRLPDACGGVVPVW